MIVKVVLFDDDSDLANHVAVRMSLRSEREQRLMVGWEQLHVLGFPTWGPGARAARVEPRHMGKRTCIDVSRVCLIQFEDSLSNVATICSSKDTVDVSYLSESCLRSISGNGMSVACAGFAVLMAVLFVEDRR